MKPFAIFRVENFSVGTTDNKPIKLTLPTKYKPMETLELLPQVNGQQLAPVSIMKVTFVENTSLTHTLLQEAKSFLKRYIILSAIDLRLSLVSPRIHCESHSALAGESKTTVHFQDGVSIVDKVSFFSKFGASVYENEIHHSLLSGNLTAVSDDLEILQATFQIPTTETRYLFQYELLSRLAGELYGKNASQKVVKDFILTHYNPTEEQCWRIGVQSSRKNPNINQDSITFYRNVIAHPPANMSELGDIDVAQTLSGHSKAMSRAILFAIQEKQRLNGGTYSS